MYNKNLGFAFVTLLVSSGSVLATSSVSGDKSPGEVINESWAFVCPGAEKGSELEARCAGVNGGDGAGIEAGVGNNAGISSGVGNSTIYSDRQHKKAIDDRQEELKKQGAAGDILSGERLGFFTSGKLTEIERESTVLETGYESDMQGVTFGLDYFFTNKFVAGLAIGYSSTDLDYSGNSGSSDYENVSVLAYGNYRVTDNFSVDGYVGWTGVEYDLKRNVSYNLTCGCDVVNSVAHADTEADKILAGMTLAYTLSQNELSITPLIKLDYSGTYIDDYKESGGAGLAMKYQNQDIQSFKSTIGFDVSYAVSVPWGVILPKVKAGYVHEFLNHRRTVHASFVEDTTSYDLKFQTDQPDRDYFVLGGGVSAVLTHSVQLFVDYERIEGHRYMNNYTVSGGVRVGF